MRTIITLGLGALAMYLLDPQQGRTRRAQARDQLSRAKRLVRERAQGRTVDTELQLEQPAQTPPSAQHLGR